MNATHNVIFACYLVYGLDLPRLTKTIEHTYISGWHIIHQWSQ